MKIIVIGGGGAGTTAASLIKQMQPKTQIDIFTLRNDIGYPPCEMPFVLGGEIKFKNIFMHPKEHLMKMFRIHFATEVKTIDPENKKVYADKTYSYDKLIIATGARPFVPFPIHDATNVFELSTDLRDARKILKAAKTAKHIAIIGAGAIGLELAQAFQRQGKKVSLIEHFDRVLPKLIDKDTSLHIEEILKKHKIALYHSMKIKEIKGKKKKEIHFDTHHLKADMVIIATGSHPNITLAKAAGIKTNRGVLVNKYMETNKKDIYAVGDVIEGWDLYLKQRLNIMVANNAILSAKIAAMNILGKKVAYKGSALPFSITIFGNLVQTLGWNEEWLARFKVPYKKVVHHALTRKPELGGGNITIKLLYDPKKLTLLGAQVFSEDLEFQELNRMIVIATKKIPLPEASLIETSYTPPIDMPMNALSIAMAKVR